ncbi:DgyrCDS6683 [Dimorphilus gyrociliatus]|uniref:DgyrCDS6683 n=1 Tax=Dimorphilus gyrociliatus TaxID=2664684 RepID=A0A7I8VNS2_9ANNE|nr:DgyrCDS6683 [Dimorphilus gyrociliatus]
MSSKRSYSRDRRDRRSDDRSAKRRDIKRQHSSDSESPRRDSYDRKRQRDRYDRRDRRNDRPKHSQHAKSYSDMFGKKEKVDEKKEPEKPKEKPNFGLSGKLAAETNTYKGVVIKYAEPPEAMKPKKRWRLYPFKEGEALSTLYIHRQSAYLIGRDRKIADMPVDHPSCSKQHAVIQYRLMPFTREDGSKGKRVVPYIIDLGSTNGTYVNGERIEAQRYVELIEKDLLKFGFSSREYILLHENSGNAGGSPREDSPKSA